MIAQRSQPLAMSACFHLIATIAAIAEIEHYRDRQSAIVAIAAERTHIYTIVLIAKFFLSDCMDTRL